MRLIFLHGLFAVSAILTFNAAALTTAYAPGSAYARIAGIMAPGLNETAADMVLAERARALLRARDFRTRLRTVFSDYGLGARYTEFFGKKLEDLRDGKQGESDRTLNDLHPEAALEVGEFIAGKHRGGIRNRAREFLERVAALDAMASADEAQTDYRIAFVAYYRDRYLSSWLNDIYRDVLFSPRQDAAAWPERVLAGFLATYRDKLHILVHASDRQLYRIFQIELVAAVEGRSAAGDKCRTSSLLWAGRNLKPPSPLAWRRESYRSLFYRWTEHDFRSEAGKLDIIMSIGPRVPGPAEAEHRRFRSRFDILKYREERAVRKKLGIPYKFGSRNPSTGRIVYPFKPFIQFPESWKIRENYCDLLYTSLSYRHNLTKPQLLLYTRQLLRRRIENIHRWANGDV